jgi:hypothetical protein
MVADSSFDSSFLRTGDWTDLMDSADAVTLSDQAPRPDVDCSSARIAQQVFFFRPTVVATLELVSDELLSRIETMLSMGDKVIEELVLALPDARDRDLLGCAPLNSSPYARRLRRKIDDPK